MPYSFLDLLVTRTVPVGVFGYMSSLSSVVSYSPGGPIPWLHFLPNQNHSRPVSKSRDPYYATKGKEKIVGTAEKQNGVGLNIIFCIFCIFVKYIITNNNFPFFETECTKMF